MKIAVLFPGIGYHCDKPLLYYSAKLAVRYGYEILKVSYTNLSRSIPDAFADACAQTEKFLQNIDWNKYEDILFISKSIGTAVAAAYAKNHDIHCKNIYYTPLTQTFDFSPQPGIVFHGTNDPWAETSVIERKCQDQALALQIIENADHSLETKDCIRKSIQILADTMELTQLFIAYGIFYRSLCAKEISRELFRDFIRHQNVIKCWRKEDGKWMIRDAPFIDDWTEADYQILVACLKNTVQTGGLVCAAFCGNASGSTLKGFVSVEPTLFGDAHSYLDLSSIHVSEDMRGKGIGKTLFHIAKDWAKKKGAQKLYISAHSAVETQAFYKAMGCVEAQIYDQRHVEQEPCDCQLECALF